MGANESLLQNARKMQDEVEASAAQLRQVQASNHIFRSIEFPFALESKMRRLIDLERQKAAFCPQTCGCGLEQLENEQKSIRNTFIEEIRKQPQYSWVVGAQPITPEDFIMSTRPSAVKLEVQTRSFHYDFSFDGGNSHDQDHFQSGGGDIQIATASASGTITSEVTLEKIIKGRMNYSIQIDSVEDQTPPISLGGLDYHRFPLMVFDISSSLYIRDEESRRVKDLIFSHLRGLDCPKDIFIELEDSFVNSCKTGTFVVGRDLPWNDQFFVNACVQGQGFQAFCQFVQSVPIIKVTLEKVIGFSGMMDIAYDPSLVEQRIKRLDSFPPKIDTSANPNPVFGDVHLFSQERQPYQKLRSQMVDIKSSMVSKSEHFHSTSVSTSHSISLGAVVNGVANLLGK